MPNHNPSGGKRQEFCSIPQYPRGVLVEARHYDLCVPLFADAQAFLAALAEYDRIRDAKDKELFGITSEDSWEEVERKRRGR